MPQHLTLTLKNDLSELQRASSTLDEFGQRHALPAAVLFDLHLALDEILTNVMSYGYDDDAQHEIVVHLSVSPDRPPHHVEVEVEDDGRPFNPLDVARPNIEASIEDRPVGGLGIYLVRRVMDDLEYRRQPGKNVLVMRKTLAG
jgi:anti-sigma regulatory factor (Ser/Thr protein kinase)